MDFLGVPCKVLAAFSKSLLQFRSPRPDEIIQFLVPEDAMLDKMNNFLKMNAQVNTLKQNASILAGLTESSITNHSDEEDALPERNGAGIDPATPPRRNGSTNIQGGGDSAGNTPAVRRRHPGVVAAAKAEFHPAASPSGVLADSPLPGQELPPSIDVAIPISIREQVSVLTNAYGQGMWVWGFGRSTYGGIRLLPRRAEYPETFLGGMIGAATAIAVVRAVAGIGWRGEVNVLGLRSKSTLSLFCTCCSGFHAQVLDEGSVTTMSNEMHQWVSFTLSFFAFARYFFSCGGCCDASTLAGAVSRSSQGC